MGGVSVSSESCGGWGFITIRCNSETDRRLRLLMVAVLKESCERLRASCTLKLSRKGSDLLEKIDAIYVNGAC